MTHPSEDQLLTLALGIASHEEERDMRTHLMSCASCSNQLRSIERDIEVISSLAPDVASGPNPVARRDARVSNIMRAAAILLIGFTIGSLSTIRIMSEPPSVRASGAIQTTSHAVIQQSPAPDATATF